MRLIGGRKRSKHTASLTAAAIYSMVMAPALVQSAPTQAYPFNNQLPPVARYGQPYQYTFLADTFESSSGSGIAYTATDIPSWLNFDGNTRTMTGTPPSSDSSKGDQLITFTVQATDNTGSTSVQWNLQLSAAPAPTFSSSALTAALANSGNISSDTSFVLKPNEYFEIQIPSDFFSSDGRSVVGHYSVLADHAPLPIWLNFDGAANKWWGNAPVVNSQIAQAATYDLLLIDSTYNGFESAAAEFSLVLGANVLTMNIDTDTVNATVGEPVQYQIPFGNISLNGVEIKQANLSSVNVSIPQNAQSWLTYDSANDTLVGTPPQSDVNTSVTVDFVIIDTYGDKVSFAVKFDITDQQSTSVFSTSSLPDANATDGTFFSYSLENYILNKGATVQVDSDASWLQYHADNYTLNGNVPNDFNTTTIYLKASLPSSASKRDVSDVDVDDYVEGIEERSQGSDRATQATAHFTLYGVSKETTTTSKSSSQITTSGQPSSSRATSSGASSTKASSSQGSATASTGASASGSSSASKTSNGASGTATATSSSLSGLPQGKSKSGTSNAVAIGCGVGISVGVVALLALALLIFCLRRRKTRAAAGGVVEEGDGGDGGSGGPGDAKSPETISAPRPPSKGLIMAPVFRTGSNSSDDVYTSAEEETMYGTPEKKMGWDSPQRASAMNFLTMDGNSSNEHVDQATLTNMAPIGAANGQAADIGTPGTLLAPAPPESREEDDEFSNIPRNSWRHTNVDDRRWQDARISYSSIASIAPTEAATVQKTGDEDARLPEPNQPITREASSGIIHRVGSHSSSMYSQQHQSQQQAQLQALAEAQSRNQLAVSATRDSSFPQFQSDNGDRGHRIRQSAISENFRTGSSGDDHSFSDEGEVLKPYRDAAGELHWQKNDATGNRVQTGTVYRKPSKVNNAHEGEEHSGELAFV